MGDRVDESNGKTYKEFIIAVESNNISTVEAMLQSMQEQEIILDINAANEENKTPLIIAIISKQTGK